MGWLKNAWKDPVGSAVISAGIVTVMGGVGTYLAGWMPKVNLWFLEVGIFLAKSVSIPRWLVGIWLGATIGCGAAVAVAQRRRNALKRVATNPAREDFQAYDTDEFFGYRWRWKTDGSGRASGFAMYCANCDCQIHSSDIFECSMLDYGTRCPSCHVIVEIGDRSVTAGIMSAAKRMAERKLRTGEWRRTVALERGQNHPN